MRLLLAVLLTCCATLVTVAAQAQESKLVRFAVYGDPPWVIQENGENKGGWFLITVRSL